MPNVLTREESGTSDSFGNWDLGLSEKSQSLRCSVWPGDGPPKTSCSWEWTSLGTEKLGLVIIALNSYSNLSWAFSAAQLSFYSSLVFRRADVYIHHLYSSQDPVTLLLPPTWPRWSSPQYSCLRTLILTHTHLHFHLGDREFTFFSQSNCLHLSIFYLSVSYSLILFRSFSKFTLPCSPVFTNLMSPLIPKRNFPPSY